MQDEISLNCLKNQKDTPQHIYIEVTPLKGSSETIKSVRFIVLKPVSP